MLSYLCSVPSAEILRERWRLTCLTTTDFMDDLLTDMCRIEENNLYIRWDPGAEPPSQWFPEGS